MRREERKKGRERSGPGGKKENAFDGQLSVAETLSGGTHKLGGGSRSGARWGLQIGPPVDLFALTPYTYVPPFLFFLFFFSSYSFEASVGRVVGRHSLISDSFITPRGARKTRV